MRSGVHADDRDEDDQSDVHQQPLCRLRDRSEHGIPAARPSGHETDHQNGTRRAESQHDSCDVYFEQPEQHAKANSAGEECQIGRRQVALDESDEFRRTRDIVGRADDMQDVSSLQHRPRLARQRFGAPADRFEIHAARIRILPQLTQRPAVHLATGHDGRHGRQRDRQEVRVNDLRSDRAFGINECRPAGRHDDSVAPFQSQSRVQLQDFTPTLYALDGKSRTGESTFERFDARASHQFVVDEAAAHTEESRGKELTVLAPAECLFERPGLALEVRPHDLRTEPREKQDQSEVAESVGDRVRKRRIGDQLRFHVIGNR